MNHAPFVFVQGLLILADLRQGADLRTDINVGLTRPNSAGDLFGQPNERQQRFDHEPQNSWQPWRNTPPVFGANGFGNNFREYQDSQGHYRRGNSEPRFPKNHRHLGANAGGAHGVGNRVQCKDCRQGIVHIVFQFSQPGEKLRLLFFQ